MGFDPTKGPSTIDAWVMDGGRIAVLKWFIHPHRLSGNDHHGVKILRFYNTTNGHQLGQFLWASF